MLSILIPTYNYNVLPLVLELKGQADYLGMDYEILVQDDNGVEFIIENSQINTISNCNFSVNKQNLGRGKNINLLCSRSRFDYVLIMEADSFPENKRFLEIFIAQLTKSTTIIFGGVKYAKIPPPKEKLLRWKYGINRESKSLKYRLKNNYDFVFSWNLLLKKEILAQYSFPEFINEYGYEDSLFLKKISLNLITVTHIENPLVHYNTEDNAVFIKKTERAVMTLYDLIHSRKIKPQDIKLSHYYIILKKLYLIGIIKAIYAKTKKMILYNLNSANPNLYLLDFYKLGFLCTLKK